MSVIVICVTVNVLIAANAAETKLQLQIFPVFKHFSWYFSSLYRVLKEIFPCDSFAEIFTYDACHPRSSNCSFKHTNHSRLQPSLGFTLTVHYLNETIIGIFYHLSMLLIMSLLYVRSFFSPLGMAPVVGLVGLGLFQRGFPVVGSMRGIYCKLWLTSWIFLPLECGVLHSNFS